MAADLGATGAGRLKRLARSGRSWGVATGNFGAVSSQRRSLMSANNRDEPAFSTGRMIDLAAGLRSIAAKIDRESSAAFKKGDLVYFSGSFLAAPVLWALGIEIALKAWLCRDLKGDPPRDHDLLCLFDRLDCKTQKLLEEAWQRGRGTGTVDDPIHELVEPQRVREARTMKELIYPRPSRLSEILEEYRKVFMDWRYLYEMSSATLQTDVLDKVLTVLIDTYWKHRED